MAIFPEDVMEKVGKSDWYSGADFEGDGLTLQIKKVDRIKSQFGASADSGMVERGILEEGEVFRYTFGDSSGEEKNFDSHSMPFMIAMNDAGFNLGDWLLIKRTGKLRDTRYTAEKVADVKVSPRKDTYPTEELKAEDIPFSG